MPFTLKEAVDCVKNEGLCAELDEAFLQTVDDGFSTAADWDKEFDQESFFWILYGYYNDESGLRRRKLDKWLSYDHRFLNDSENPVLDMSDCLGGEPFYTQVEWKAGVVVLQRFDGDVFEFECDSIQSLIDLFNQELARRDDNRRFYEMSTGSDFTAHYCLPEEGFIRLSRVLPFEGQQMEAPSAAREKRQMEQRIQNFDLERFGHEKRAAMYEEIGKLDEALQDYQTAIAQIPTDGSAVVTTDSTNRTRLLLRSALVLRKLQRLDDALIVCDQIITATRSDRLATMTRGKDAYWMKYDILTELGENEKAAATMRAIETLDELQKQEVAPKKEEPKAGIVGRFKKLFGGS
ncbi:MAG TPA: tetratricopeptide repeat protein [Planktothrix sp.]|jgi:tetratricopeptide (TPR) repeat protein